MQTTRVQIQAFLRKKADAATTGARSRSHQVHLTRVQSKRMRAALQLWKPIISRAEFKKQENRIEAAAKRLANQRDTDVLAAQFRDVASAFNRSNRRSLEHWIKERIPRKVTAHVGDALKKSNELLAKSLAQWPSTADTPGLLRCGIEKSYCRARKCFRCALKSKRSADFHKWRSATKRLCLQLEIARAAHCKINASRFKRFDRLQKKLGDAHDLAVAEAFIRAHGEQRDKFLESTLEKLETRRATLEKKLLKRGGKIFEAQKSIAF